MRTTIFAVLLAAGCAPSGPRTYPVSGRIDLGGDVAVLAGSHVEAVLATDPYVRASGEIQPDGTFTLQSQHGGTIAGGAIEGGYTIRLLLNDDDKPRYRKAKAAVAGRFLKFESSGLTLRVPADGPVVLKVPGR